MGFNDINLQVSGPQQPASTYKTKVLKGQVPFATQVTEPNTKYVIKHNFVLNGDVTIPENCILEFDGGGVSGEHTITGQNTGIEAGWVKILGTDVTFDGTWNVAEVYPEWFGAKGDGVTDDTLPVQKSLDFTFFTSKNAYKNSVVFSQRYLITSELIVRCNTIFKNRATLIGSFTGILFHIVQSWTTHYNITLNGANVEGSCGIKVGGVIEGESTTRGYYTSIYTPIVSGFEYGMAICTFQNDIVSPKIVNCVDAVIAAETQNAGWINLNRFFGGTLQGTRYAAFMGDNRNLPILPSNQNNAKQGINIDFFGTQIIGKATLQNVSPVAFYGCSFEWIDGQSSEDKLGVELLAKTTSIVIDNCSFDKYNYAVKCLQEFRNISITNCVFSRITYCGVYTTDNRGVVTYKANKQENTCFTDGAEIHVGGRPFIDLTHFDNLITENLNCGKGYQKFSFNGVNNKAIYPEYSKIGSDNILSYNSSGNYVLPETAIPMISGCTVVGNNKIQFPNNLSVAGLVPGLLLRIYNGSSVTAYVGICNIDYENNSLTVSAYIGNVTNLKFESFQVTLKDVIQVTKNNTTINNLYAGKAFVNTDRRFIGFYDGANQRRYDGNMLTLPPGGDYSQYAGAPSVVLGTVFGFTDYLTVGLYTNRGWKTFDGISINQKRYGSTSDRPVGVHEENGSSVGELIEGLHKGFMYFDTTLGKPVFAKNINSTTGVVTWVDATGATV